jgi:hypothetical protein
MNMITNTKPRRMSMAYFTGLFLLALAVPCIAFIKSTSLSRSLPAKEVAELKEKERIVKSFADLSDNLRAYQTAQSANDPNATRLAADCKNMMMKLYGELSGKDTSRVYLDINRSLQMANQYFEFTQRSNISQNAVNPLIAQLQSEKQQLQNDNQLLKMQLVTRPQPSGGGGGGAPQIIYRDKECPPCAPGSAPAPVVDCQVKVTEYKSKIHPSLTLMAGNINNIRTELSHIKCWIGQNKEEKKIIDGNLKSLENTINSIQGQ